MYEGMSYLKLYKNHACTRELEKDSNGNYILDINLVTSNNQNPYQTLIWVKNVGTHKAYRTAITLISSTITTNLEGLNTTTILPQQALKIKITMNIPVLSVGNHRVVINVDYDSL